MTVATVAPDLKTCCTRCGGPFLEALRPAGRSRSEQR
jgi:hypothetical protein